MTVKHKSRATFKKPAASVPPKAMRNAAKTKGKLSFALYPIRKREKQ